MYTEVTAMEPGHSVLPSQQTVLVITDDPLFAHDLMGRWQMERSVPSFTVLSGSSFHAGSIACDLAIVGTVEDVAAAEICRKLELSGNSVLFAAPDNHVLHSIRTVCPRAVGIQQHDGWPDALVMLGVEVLRRLEIQNRIKRLEQTLALQKRNAALGKYMLESRHSFNNTLTSILGNAELLQLNLELLPKGMREQVDTVHSMALRLHEIMQRFTSLEVEMSFAEKSSQPETARLSHPA